MKWIIKLVSEITPGQRQEYDLVELERTNPMTPGNLGLAIAEGKTILAAIQKRGKKSPSRRDVSSRFVPVKN